MKLLSRIRNASMLLLIISTIVACGGDDDDDTPASTPTATPTMTATPTQTPTAMPTATATPTPQIQTLTIALEGDQEVPMVDSPHTVSATVTINETDMQIDASMDLSSIDDVTAAHIHSGTIGTNGGVVFAFADDDSDNVWEISSQAISNDDLTSLLSAEYYINVHTTTVASGELRGQIITDTMTVFTFTLNGSQEVPSTDSSATGEGYALFNSDGNSIALKAITTGVTATAAHIHQAEAGANGDVAVGLEQGMDTNMWMAPMSSTLTADQVTALLAGEMYVNVHSAAVPSGEIRGQILPENTMLAVFPIAADQEVPPTTSMASGIGYLTLDVETGSLSLNAWTFDMTGTAAHIHAGNTGANGDVVVGLVENGDTSGLWQAPDNTQLSEANIAIMLNEGHYVNVHSATEPAGEIRGQITF